MQCVALVLLVAGQALSAQPVVTFLTGAELTAEIQTAPKDASGSPGLYMMRLAAASENPVLGIRRTGTGSSEVHSEFADVLYVLQGSATFVTGGTVVDGAEGLPGEIRGRGISGGETRHLHAGELAVVPAGVPHWISEVEGKEILYMVVKVPTNK